MASAILASLCLTLGSGISQATYADEGTGSESSPHHRHSKKEKKAFIFGVCVGEALAKQGIVPPSYERGSFKKWDEATKAAFKTAMKTCKDAFKENAPPSSDSEPSDSDDDSLSAQ